MIRTYCAEALILFLGGILIAGGVCQAQATQMTTQPTQPYFPPSSYTPEPAFYTRPQGNFGRGSFGLSVGAEGLTVTNANHDTLGFLTFGAEYLFMKRIAIAAEFDLCPGTFEAGDEGCPSDARFNLRAYGGLLMVRGYVAQLSDLSLYIDAGIGGMHGNGAFPAEGSDTNWMQAVGFGVSLHTTPNISFLAGARYVRLGSDFIQTSKAPEFNGFEYYVGISFRS